MLPVTLKSLPSYMCLDTLEGDDVRHLNASTKVTCKNYTPDQLRNLKHNDFSIMHCNISSLNKHHDDLVSLLSTIDYNPLVIGCTESWLNHNSYIDLLNLDGYMLHHKDRPNRVGGGACLFVHSSLHANVCDDLFIDYNPIDSIFIVGHQQQSLSRSESSLLI